MASDVLDEAYVRLHHWGPEWGGENGLSNHGPMAVEVLSRRGFDDQVGTWLDRYVTRLEALPGPGVAPQRQDEQGAPALERGDERGPVDRADLQHVGRRRRRSVPREADSHHGEACGDGRWPRR